MMCWPGGSCQITGPYAPVVRNACWRYTSQTPDSLAGEKVTLQLHILCAYYILVSVRAVPDVLAWSQLPNPRAWPPAWADWLWRYTSQTPDSLTGAQMALQLHILCQYYIVVTVRVV